MDLRSRRLVAAGLSILVAAGACDFPRDPEGTLDRVRGGVVRAGITAHPPWTALGARRPRGLEVTLVEELAAELDATVEWTEGSEESLMGALELRRLDLVVGGLTATNPWAAKVAFTHPYVTTAVVVAAPAGSDALQDIAGIDVAAEAGTEAAGILEKTDARVHLVDDVATAAGTVAIDNYLVDDLGLADTGVRLAEHDHVWAAPVGENAWITYVERFLLAREEDVERLLDEVEP